MAYPKRDSEAERGGNRDKDTLRKRENGESVHGESAQRDLIHRDNSYSSGTQIASEGFCVANGEVRKKMTEQGLQSLLDHIEILCSGDDISDETKQRLIAALETDLQRDDGDFDDTLTVYRAAVAEQQENRQKQEQPKNGIRDRLARLKKIPAKPPSDEELFLEKNRILAKTCGEPLDVLAFYREVFPVGAFERRGHSEDDKPNGIVMAVKAVDGRSISSVVFDDLQDIERMNREYSFVITAPVAYVGKRRCAGNARLIYGICVDLDDVGKKELVNLLFQFQNSVLPSPTLIANSGHGMHLYYIFDAPVKMNQKNSDYLRELKFGLIEQIWNPYTSACKDRQMQGLFQGFRAVGSRTKLGDGYTVTGFRYGKTVSVEYLREFVTNDAALQKIEEHKPHTLDECADLFPEWYQRRIVERQPPMKWRLNRGMYDNWKKRIFREAKVGHRYFCIVTLAIYAKKCSIPFQDLKADAMALIGPYNAIAPDNPFTEEDAKDALKAYYAPKIELTKKKVISRWTNIPIGENRRNGRKQADHLVIARAVRDIEMERQGRKWDDNSGRKPLQKQVLEWRAQNPNGTKAQCIKDTGLSKPTVYKWWDTDAETTVS